MAFVCLIEVRLHVAESDSLKSKRKVVRSVKDAVRERLGATVAEIEGQDTWQRSTLLCALVGLSEADLTARLRPELAAWFGAEANSWQHLRSYTLPQALPAYPAGQPAHQPLRLTDHLYRCGDYTAYPSLNAAMQTGREVAEQLRYSERTIKNVIHDVVTKLNVRTRSQAVAQAVREGLI